MPGVAILIAWGGDLDRSPNPDRRSPYHVGVALISTPRRIAALGAVFAALGGIAVLAASAGVDQAAVVSVTADRVTQPVGDLAVAFDIGAVDQFVVAGVDAAVTRVGGVAAVSRSGSLGLRRLVRAGVTVHAPPSGYLIPITFISLPKGAIGGVFGADVSAVVNDHTVVINQVTAESIGAQQGDMIELRADNGSAVTLTIGGIRPYDQLGWAELVFTTEVAERLGATSDTRVVMWGFDDRVGLDAALVDVGVIGRRDTKVTHSWDPPDPDDTLSTAHTKVALGEPWYRINSDGSLSMHPVWEAANLTDGRLLLDPIVRIRARCHVRVAGDLSAALADVAAAGLGYAIEVANANVFGGCYSPRYSRTSGFLSRHAYAMALDTNTVSNCGGCRPPRMNCDVVRIFRKHGFAWGGNFRQPDGMHFEWVGEPRDQIQFASNYCPNIVNPFVESASVAPIGRGVLTAGEAGMVHDHPDGP